MRTRGVDESDLEWSPGDEREDLGRTRVSMRQVHTARHHVEPHVRDPLRPKTKYKEPSVTLKTEEHVKGLRC